MYNNNYYDIVMVFLSCAYAAQNLEVSSLEYKDNCGIWFPGATHISRYVICVCACTIIIVSFCLYIDHLGLRHLELSIVYRMLWCWNVVFFHSLALFMIL